MPVVHNFGHVAVSGCAFYRSGALDPDWRGNLFVVHFNTQRVTRMELAPDGATYRVTEREFLKLQNPDAHLTDVLEDRDGSLLVVDTGGWFRIGCPASVMAKPDIAGAIYRIRKSGAPAKVEPWGIAAAKVWELARKGDAASVKELTSLLAGKDDSVARAAGNALASLAKPEAAPSLVRALSHPNPGVQLAAAHALGEMPSLDQTTIDALLKRLEGEVDRSVEHQAMFALLHAGQAAPLVEALRNSHQARTAAPRARDARPVAQLSAVRDGRSAVARVTRRRLGAHGCGHRGETSGMDARRDRLFLRRAEARQSFVRFAHAARNRREAVARGNVRALNWYPFWPRAPTPRASGVRGASSHRQAAPPREPRCVAPLKNALATAAPADLPLLLDAIANLHAPELDAALKEFAADDKRALSLRLKALSACIRPDSPLAGDTCPDAAARAGRPNFDCPRGSKRRASSPHRN